MHDFDPDLDGPGKLHPVQILRDGEVRSVPMKWGLRPIQARPVSLLQAERWQITNPCLIPMNEFALKPEDSSLKYAASLITDEPFFCVAGMWRAAERDWPASFAALTVPAYPDLALYKDRHMAVVRPEDWWDWLAQTRPEEELLRPFPRGSFDVSAPKSGRRVSVSVPQSGRPAASGDLFGLGSGFSQ
jgi:putative SOS response-associated peptidase YedK